jgi:hypothetical protein
MGLPDHQEASANAEPDGGAECRQSHRGKDARLDDPDDEADTHGGNHGGEQTCLRYLRARYVRQEIAG